jgi:GT2 family glycosyltransferase
MLDRRSFSVHILLGRTWHLIGPLRNRGDALTGGGFRALSKRWSERLRATGDRITGGGLRSLAKRLLTKSVARAISQPFLKAIGRAVLQPFPNFLARIDRLAPSSVLLAATEISACSSTRPSDHSLLVNSFYKASFDRLADECGLATWVGELQSGTSTEVLADHIVRSAEFQTRHGSKQEVDIKFVTALYRDGLGRPPELEALASWLTEGKRGATRAKVLAGIAGSGEALARAHLHSPETEMNYSRWVAAFDTMSGLDRAVIRTHILGLPFRPVISVIVPIDTPSEVRLRASFNSVATQLYPNWELCFAFDTVTEPPVMAIASEWPAGDLRVKVTRLTKVDGIAAATNAALNAATGEFVAFLRSGDILPENALYEAVFALGQNNRPDIVYSDCDHLNRDGRRTNPWFKPDWDPDLLLSQDYVTGLVVYRRTLVEAIGCLRPGFAGAEFHDLALRATAASAPDRVRHVPAILYHRSEKENAIPSQSVLSELPAVDASRRATRDYLDSRGDLQAIVESAPQIPSATRVVWPVPTPEPLVSVIVPTRDRADLLAQCVTGVLRRTDYRNLELLIVDNGSIESVTLRLFDQLVGDDERIRILHHPGPFNYSALNNAAARETNGEILLLLNNDISVIESGWLRELVSQALRPEVGVVGAKLLYVNEQVQHGGIVLGPGGSVVHLHRRTNRNNPGYFGQLALPRRLSAVTGACLAIRRAVFFEVGGLDEVNLPVNFSDIDLCLRAGDYGYGVVWTPFAELFHLEGASRGLDGTDAGKRELEHMLKTWGSLLDSADPFHNPNLLFSSDRIEISAWPRRRRTWRDLGEQFLELRLDFAPVDKSSRRTPPYRKEY